MELIRELKSKSCGLDGGATVNNLLMQFQCDLIRYPLVRPKITETYRLGAAYLAGLAVGYWESIADMEHSVATRP